MKELSLHILDIVQNSINAGADIIKITIIEDTLKDSLTIIIEDNGKGMDKEIVDKVKDPFFTSRTTRKVGLGIPLFYAAAKRCDGDLIIDSEYGRGTRITASFGNSHIDRAPIGNIHDTITGLILCNENIDFEYTHFYNDKEFQLSTINIKNTLQEVPITSYEIIDWIREYIKEGIKSLYGGVDNEINTGAGGNKKENPTDFKC